MVSLVEKSALNGFSQIREELSVSEVTDFELISVAAARGSEIDFEKRFTKTLKISPPHPNQVVQIDGGAVIWTGQNQCLVMLGTPDVHADIKLGETLGDSAYAVLQSDGWACLRLTGGRFYDVMDRFIPLDLRRAEKDFAARTQAHHISVIVVKQLDESWLLLTPRSTAHSFMGALIHVITNVLG